jgi:hypothetical protein
VSVTATDKTGRKLVVRRLDALAKLRLFKAVGPTNSKNDPYLGMAMLAACVLSIDDIPVVLPVNEQQIEALVAKLGDDGIEAVAEVMPQLMPDTSEETIEAAKN